MKALVLAALAAWAGAAPALDKGRALDGLGWPCDTTYGVLLLGQGGDQSWTALADAARKQASQKKLLVEFSPGDADAKEIQKAVDRLQLQRVKKIVAVPLYLSSYSDVVDQDRFLFGIREKPSQAALGGPHAHLGGQASRGRLKLKVPVVMTKALDDTAAVVDALAARAKALSHEPARESLVLVGQAPASSEGLKDWVSVVNALAEKVRQKLGMARAQAAALRDLADRQARDNSEREVRDSIAALQRQGEVVVIPLELSPDYVRARLPSLLEGLLVRYDGKTILPEPKLADWILSSAAAASSLPDMRVFKDTGKGGLLSTPANQLKAGSQLEGGSQLKSHGGY